MADGSIKFDLDILDEKAKKRMQEIEALIENAGDSVDEELTNKAMKFVKEWEKAENQYKTMLERMKAKSIELEKAIDKEVDMDRQFGIDSREYQEALSKVKQIELQHQNLAIRAEEYIVKQDQIGIKMADISDEIAKQHNEALGLNELIDSHNQKVEEQAKAQETVTKEVEKQKTILDSIKERIDGATNSFVSWVYRLRDVDVGTKAVASSSRSMNNSFKSGTKSLIRLSMAMFGVRGVMTGLTRITREWYASNDIGAKQAQANIQAMTHGIMNMLAPALQLVTNLMSTIMGYINAIFKTFFGIDLLVGSTAKHSKGTSGNLGKGAKNAKKLKKEVDGFTAGFDEADVASSKIADNLDGAGAGGGGGGGVGGPAVIEPTIKTPDLSKLKAALQPFLDTIASIDLQPLTEAFNTLGKSVKRTGELIGITFVNMMNNTMGPFIKLMAEEIAPRALLAISSVLDAINRQLEWILPEFVEPFFHWFMMDFVPAALNIIISAFELLAPVIDAVGEALRITYHEVWKPFGEWVGGILVEIMNGLAEALQEIGLELDEDNESVVGTLASMMKLGSYILILIGVYKIISGIVGVATTAFNIFKFAVGGVSAAGKVLAGVIKLLTASKLGWVALIAVVVAVLYDLVTDFDKVKEDIADIINNIKGIISGLTDFIAGIFTGDWKRAWKGVVKVFANIVGGIANIFKLPLNIMIGGINSFIKAVNKIQIPNWVPGVGGKGINIPTIPKLAKGGVLTHQTVAMMAEYPNARTNPEIVTPESKMRKIVAEELMNQGGGGFSEGQVIRIEMPVMLSGKQIHKEIKEIETRELLQNNRGGDLGWNP